MQTAFSIVGHTKVQFLGSRFRARELRAELEGLLVPADELVLDFTGMILSGSENFLTQTRMSMWTLRRCWRSWGGSLMPRTISW